jgi:hypothetical protein
MGLKLSLLKTEERNALLEFADLLRERFGFLIKEVILKSNLMQFDP